MHDYNRDHFRFRRQSGFTRKDFDDTEPPCAADRVVFIAALYILLLLLLSGVV
jgi:hypothetical protein